MKNIITSKVTHLILFLESVIITGLEDYLCYLDNLSSIKVRSTSKMFTSFLYIGVKASMITKKAIKSVEFLNRLPQDCKI